MVFISRWWNKTPRTRCLRQTSGIVCPQQGWRGNARSADGLAGKGEFRKTRMRAASYLLTLLVAGAIASCDKPQTVNLTLIDYQFIPDHLTFQHDVHYRLHVENHGKETHEVTAPTFFASAEIDNPDVLNGYGSDIVLQPGATKDLYFTARRPGTYDLRCADHDWNGMLGGITVE
jgi:uncharacterized cupredoxin-like copper-binding protein